MPATRIGALALSDADTCQQLALAALVCTQAALTLPDADTGQQLAPAAHVCTQAALALSGADTCRQLAPVAHVCTHARSPRVTADNDSARSVCLCQQASGGRVQPLPSVPCVHPSGGHLSQRAQCIYQSEVKVHVLHTASEVNRTILSAARPTRPPPESV